MKDTVTYLLRNVKKDLWHKVKVKAVKMKITIRQFIFDALKDKLKRK